MELNLPDPDSRISRGHDVRVGWTPDYDVPATGAVTMEVMRSAVMSTDIRMSVAVAAKARDQLTELLGPGEDPRVTAALALHHNEFYDKWSYRHDVIPEHWYGVGTCSECGKFAGNGCATVLALKGRTP